MILYNKQRVLRGHYESLSSSILAAKNIRIEGPVTLAQGDFVFSPDTRIHFEEGSRLTSGGFYRFWCNEMIGHVAGGEHPMIEFMPADPTMNPANRWEPINTLRVYYDHEPSNWWGENPKHWKADHIGGNIVTLFLVRNRFSSFDTKNPDLSHYEQNRWLVNGIPADRCEIDLNGMGVTVKLFMPVSIPGPVVSWWTDQPKNYQRNIRIGRIHAQDVPVGALSVYGALGASIDEIIVTGGRDTVTLEYCRGCSVKYVHGIDTHQGFNVGNPVIEQLFLAEGNRIDPGCNQRVNTHGAHYKPVVPVVKVAGNTSPPKI